MRISYYSDTDTLYVDLKEMPGADTRECMDDFVVDIDSDGKPVGIEIEHASEKVDLSHLETEGLASMSITYEPITSTRYSVWEARHTLPDLQSRTAFNVSLRNEESAHLIAEQLRRQTESDLADLGR